MLRLFLALALVAAAQAQTSVVGEGGGGASDLDALTDVTLTSPADGDGLRYSGSAWVNTALFDATTTNLRADRMATNWGTAGATACATAGGVLYGTGSAVTCSSALTLSGDELLIDSSGSSTTNPAQFGYSSWSSGSAARTAYGSSTGFQSAFGYALQLYGFQGIVIRGDTTSSNPPSFESFNSQGLLVINGVRVLGKSGRAVAEFQNSAGNNLMVIGGNQAALIQDQTATTGVTTAVVKAGAGQSTTDLLQWQDNAGNVLGRITSDGYGALPAVQLVDPGTKPACSSDTRGMIWYDAGGAGVADAAEICGKDASDVYAWVAIATF